MNALDTFPQSLIKYTSKLIERVILLKQLFKFRVFEHKGNKQAKKKGGLKKGKKTEDEKAEEKKSQNMDIRGEEDKTEGSKEGNKTEKMEKTKGSGRWVQKRIGRRK